MSEDLAGNSLNTSQTRLSRSGWRLVLEWALPLLAIGLLFLVFRSSHLIVVREFAALFSFSFPSEPRSEKSDPFATKRLTPDQRLVLKGDTTRSNAVERQKAIWDRWPTNHVYLHNYITQRVSDYPYTWSERHRNCPQRAAFGQDLKKYQSRDPDNARFDYLLASTLIPDAASNNWHSVTNTDGIATLTATVLDRAKLDQAMSHFKAGLGKPVFRRYSQEMVTERLAILGEPVSLAQSLAQIGIVAGTLQPDLSRLRELARCSSLYANLLIDEGRKDEAREFLAAWRRYVPQVNRDVYCLIDVLVMGAISDMMDKQVPATYRRLGDAEAAQQTGLETAALAKPVKDWKDQRKQLEDNGDEERLHRRAGLLASLLLPALRVPLTDEELAPSRFVEYAVIDSLGAFAISVVMIGIIAICALLLLYYRLRSPTLEKPALAVPGLEAWLWLIGVGVLLPVAAYYGLTRWIPNGPRMYGIGMTAPQLILQQIALLLVIGAALMAGTSRWVRQGWQGAGIPTLLPLPIGWRIWGGVLLVATVVLPLFSNPAAVRIGDDYEPIFDWLALSMGFLLVAWGLSVLGVLIYGSIVRDWFRSRHAAYYGSLARTLIPALSLAIIVLNSVAHPVLGQEERYWMKRDTVLRVDRNGGFTAVEARLTQRLKGEIQKAAGTKDLE
jgi:hypothetical protein